MVSVRWSRTTAIIAVCGLLPVFLAGAARAESRARPQQPAVQFEHSAVNDKDVRSGRRAPSALQRQLADGANVRWNRFGTPSSLSRDGAPLATGLPGDHERAARAYLSARHDLFGLTERAVQSLEKVAVQPIGKGAAVLFRQRFGDLPAAAGGLVAVGVVDGKVHHVSSSLAPDSGPPPAATLDRGRALEAVARDAGIEPARARTERVTLVAVPTARGARSAYQATVIGPGTVPGEPTAVTSYVDARTGEVLVRRNLVVHYSDEPGNPSWSAFPATPRGDYSSTDTRRRWCQVAGPGCDFVVGGDPPTGLAWDVDHATGQPTNTSLGNAARTFEKRDSGDNETVGTRPNSPRPDRNYNYAWTNQWQQRKCDPAALDSPQEADLEASIANLFAQHNRMHDWSYRLGFTELAFNHQSDNGDRGGIGGDPELGNAQAGARIATVRNNANQVVTPDGVPGITNQFLFQPIAGALYVPCIDGSYDMTIIGHEYSHAISHRMIAGPDEGWSGLQARNMDESTSDLFVAEYLTEYGFVPPGDTPFVNGGYATANRRSGIRNYDMSKSPLNYSDLNYDLIDNVASPHPNGEIWSATQLDIRQALQLRYGAGTPELRRECADGAVPVERCPGSRRWVQLSFDALLLMATGTVSYLDHRDAMLAADQIRFGGANQALLWNAFARRGLGTGASSNGTDDPDPVPGFASPHANNGTVALSPILAPQGRPFRLYVGDYEARATPVADTDSSTPLGDRVTMVPGTYTFTAVGAGLGHRRITLQVKAGSTHNLQTSPPVNHASAANGAKVAGDGVNQDKIIDDTEATNWASLTAPVAGRQVTVDLAGGNAVKVGRIQVSAMLRPNIGDPADPGGQNRFSALRQFQLLGCDAGSGANCFSDAGYTTIYTSPADAFPAIVPRPKAPDLIMRSFDVPDTAVTHLRLRVLSSQCTGNPAYAGEQDNDPRSATDCATASPAAGQVRVAELQAFTK